LKSAAVAFCPIGRLGFDENPKPGREGITRSKASAGSPPKRLGKASFSIAPQNSKCEPGQRWVISRGRLPPASPITCR